MSSRTSLQIEVIFAVSLHSPLRSERLNWPAGSKLEAYLQTKVSARLRALRCGAAAFTLHYASSEDWW